MSLFSRPKTVDGRTPEAIYAQRVAHCVETAKAMISVQGQKVNQTTRGMYVLPEITGGSGAFSPLKSYALRDVAGDYLIARKYLGYDEESGKVILGPTDIYIAKEPLHCESLTAETILGESHTYSFSNGPTETWDDGGQDSNGDPVAGVGEKGTFNRTRTDAPTAEAQRIVPPWRENEIIFAVPASTGISTEGETPQKITLLIVGRSCQWAQIHPA